MYHYQENVQELPINLVNYPNEINNYGRFRRYP